MVYLTIMVICGILGTRTSDWKNYGTIDITNTPTLLSCLSSFCLILYIVPNMLMRELGYDISFYNGIITFAIFIGICLINIAKKSKGNKPNLE